jgi:predicted ArsR family transcriptional regulator
MAQDTAHAVRDFLTTGGHGTAGEIAKALKRRLGAVVDALKGLKASGEVIRQTRKGKRGRPAIIYRAPEGNSVKGVKDSLPGKEIRLDAGQALTAIEEAVGQISVEWNGRGIRNLTAPRKLLARLGADRDPLWRLLQRAKSFRETDRCLGCGDPTGGRFGLCRSCCVAFRLANPQS